MKNNGNPKVKNRNLSALVRQLTAAITTAAVMAGSPAMYGCRGSGSSSGSSNNYGIGHPSKPGFDVIEDYHPITTYFLETIDDKIPGTGDEGNPGSGVSVDEASYFTFTTNAFSNTYFFDGREQSVVTGQDSEGNDIVEKLAFKDAYRRVYNNFGFSDNDIDDLVTGLVNGKGAGLDETLKDGDMTVFIGKFEKDGVMRYMLAYRMTDENGQKKVTVLTSNDSLGQEEMKTLYKFSEAHFSG